MYLPSKGPTTQYSLMNHGLHPFLIQLLHKLNLNEQFIHEYKGYTLKQNIFCPYKWKYT